MSLTNGIDKKGSQGDDSIFLQKYLRNQSFDEQEDQQINMDVAFDEKTRVSGVFCEANEYGLMISYNILHLFQRIFFKPKAFKIKYIKLNYLDAIMIELGKFKNKKVFSKLKKELK